MKIKEIYEFLDSFAPYETQCSWDNSGLMTGNPDNEVDSVMLCLDCTQEVITQAVSNGCKLIICHHPLIFQPVRCVNEDTSLYDAIKNGITVISAHTNLDMAQGGVNDVLCEKLGMKNVRSLDAEGKPIMRMGDASFVNAEAFARFCAQILGNSVKFTDSGKAVSKIAVCGGAGGEYVFDAFAAGCDTYITGEAKHHEYLEAQRIGINLIVAGHYGTEIHVLDALREKLSRAFPKQDFYVACEEAPYKTVI